MKRSDIKWILAAIFFLFWAADYYRVKWTTPAAGGGPSVAHEIGHAIGTIVLWSVIILALVVWLVVVVALFRAYRSLWWQDRQERDRDA